MKKRLVLLVGALCGLMAFSSCSFLTPPGGQDSSQGGMIPPSSAEAATYTITFRQDGQADVVRQVKAGEALADMPTPAGKVGYTVTWDVDGDLTNITEDMVITAVATANKYTITYNANGGAVETATQEVTYDADTTLATPTREGFTFTGWTYEKDGAQLPVESDTAWKIAEDVELTAQWTKVAVIYTVTFAQEGCEAVQVQVEEGTAVPADKIPAIVAKTGYTVVWDTTKDLTNVTGNMTVNAVATANTYKITYNANGGAVETATQDVTYDATYTLATPTWEGYEFKGWTKDGEAFAANGTWTIADNVTLVAQWQKIIKYYTVTFVQAGQVNKTFENVEENTAFTNIPEVVAKTGYTVVWNANELAQLNNVTGNVTVNAVETANTYKITYNANGGAVATATQEVTYDAAYTLATPTRDGYEFAGWTYNDNMVTAGEKWTIADNVTLVAQWTALYSVTFIQAGQPMQTFTVEDGDMFDKSLIPAIVAKTGYTVVWNANELAQLDAPIKGAVKVNAVETANKYTITYNANGGAVEAATQEVTYDAAYTLATPTWAGYEFKGWTKDGEAFAANGTWTIADNVTLVAQWQKIIKYYTVTFVQAGQVNKTFENVEENTAFTNIPEVVAKTGYTVVWNANELAQLNNVTGNVTVNAVETANTYTITYDVNNGNALTANTQNVTFDADYTLVEPTREGYTFSHWTNEGKTVAMSGKWTTASDVTLVAEWTKVIKYYTITFVQEGQENKTFEGIEENTAFTNIPEVVAKKGYTIAWKAEDLAKLANVTDNVVVTATVQAKQYNVVLNANGGTVGGAASTQQSVVYDTTYELAQPTREGYEFKGWKYNGQTVDTKGTWAIDAETIELTAEWEKLPDEEDNWTQNY